MVAAAVEKAREDAAAAGAAKRLGSGGAGAEGPLGTAGPDGVTPARSLRSRILLAATGLFAERGYAATTVREVVAAAGCTKPALYYYFDGKEELFLAALRAEAELIRDIMAAGQGGPGTVRERLRRGLDRFFDHVRGHPVPLRMLMRAELHRDDRQPDFDFGAVRQMHLSMARDLLAAGVATQEVGAGVNLDDAVLALVGMIDQWCRRSMLDGMPIPDDVAERVLEIFFGGVAP